MTEGELRVLNGIIKATWPGQGWPGLTVQAVAPSFADVELAVARKALAQLFAEGREFPPQPSTLLARAGELQEEARLYLPPPDSCREADADERARMERWRPRLREAVARQLTRPSTGNPQAVNSQEE